MRALRRRSKRDSNPKDPNTKENGLGKSARMTTKTSTSISSTVYFASSMASKHGLLLGGGGGRENKLGAGAYR